MPRPGGRVVGQDAGLELHHGDCRAILPTLAADSVHCVVTSPPYWGLRQYLFDKALVLRSDLTSEERAQVEAELAKRGIVPRQRGVVPQGDALETARYLPRK